MKKRKPSPEKECPVCGQSCAARGLKSHMRLKHGIKLTEQVVNVPDRQQVREIVQNVVQRITPSVQVELKSNQHIAASGQLPMPVQAGNMPADQASAESKMEAWVRKHQVSADFDVAEWNRGFAPISASIGEAIAKHGLDSPEHKAQVDVLIKHVHSRWLKPK